MLELMLKTWTLPVVIFALATATWLIIRGLYRDRELPDPIMSLGQFNEFIAFNEGTLEQSERYGAGGAVVERIFMGRVK